jgi:hypothetical protein
MMEPDDLWARFLEGPHRARLPRFFGGQQRTLSESTEDKGNADAIMGMEVQGLAIPAHATASGATASSRELRRRSRARHPHFQVARGRGFDPDSTLTAMDIEGVDVAVMYGTRGRQILMHDDLAPDYAAALARAYNNWAYDYCRIQPTSPVRCAGRDAQHPLRSRLAGARSSARRHHWHPQPGQRQTCTTRPEPLWSALEDLMPIEFSSDRQHLAQGRRRAPLRRSRNSTRSPTRFVTGRADGAIAKDDGGIPAPLVARRLPKAPPAGSTGGCGGSTTSGRSWPGVRASLRCCRASFKRRYIALDVDEEPAVDVVNKMGADFRSSDRLPHLTARS